MTVKEKKHRFKGERTYFGCIKFEMYVNHPTRHVKWDMKVWRPGEKFRLKT